MKPNFHAIGAIVYGLRFGLTGIPVFLRRGWLGALISVGATFGLFATIFSEAHIETLQGNMGYGIFSPAIETLEEVTNDWDGDDEFEFAWDSDDADALGDVFLYYFLQLVAVILMIPGYVDLVRKSAGADPREGFLPNFGGPEWSMLFSYILLFLATLLFYAVVALPVGGLMVFGAMSEQVWLVAIGGFASVVAVLWWAIRSQLIPFHAAVVGRIAFVEGFQLSGGRFWKLLGTFLLMIVVIFIIQFAVGILALGITLNELFQLTLVLNVLVSLYMSVATTGVMGRITGDLMGLVDEEEADPNYGAADELEEEAEDFFEEATEGVTGEDVSYTAADHWTAPQAQDRAAPTQMMRRAGEPTTQFATVAEPAQAPQEPVEAPAPRKADRPSVQFVRRRFRS